MTVVDMGGVGVRRKLDGADEANRGVGEMIFTPAFTSRRLHGRLSGRRSSRELKRRGYRTVGWLGSGAMPHSFVARVEQELAGTATFVDATEFIDRLKAIKSEEEMELIRLAAEMQDAVFARVLREDPARHARQRHHRAGAIRGPRCCGSEQGLFLGSSAPLGQASRFIDRHIQGRAAARAASTSAC